MNRSIHLCYSCKWDFVKWSFIYSGYKVVWKSPVCLQTLLSVQGATEFVPGSSSVTAAAAVEMSTIILLEEACTYLPSQTYLTLVNIPPLFLQLFFFTNLFVLVFSVSASFSYFLLFVSSLLFRNRPKESSLVTTTKIDKSYLLQKMKIRCLMRRDNCLCESFKDNSSFKKLKHR